MNRDLKDELGYYSHNIYKPTRATQISIAKESDAYDAMK